MLLQFNFRQFLLGLKKYGKGDWRNISRNFVTTRTPTQVASHAQKYFIRQLSGGKDKRRSSIHDITTVNLDAAAASKPLLPENDQRAAVVDECTTMATRPQQPQHHHEMAKALYQWNLPNQAMQNSSFIMPPLHGSSSYGPQYGHFSTVFQGNC